MGKPAEAQRLPLVLHELVKHAADVCAGALPHRWETCEATAQELAAAEREATAVAAGPFDTLNLKRDVWLAWKSGKATLLCRRFGSLARVLVILPQGVKAPSDAVWEVWGRIFTWFGAARTMPPSPWRVVWFAAPTPRKFPSIGQDLGPQHVNGGYTMVCSTDGIYIYRAEEATRVLIHELLHAACLDEAEWSIPMREAMIETWAELILIALLSKGRASVAANLWAKQAQWIADTNHRARKENGLEDMSDYAWRYLEGRVPMYERLGIRIPAARGRHPSGSLRFTHPALDI